MKTASLERRVQALESAGGSGGPGCDRCRGFLTVVKNATTGEFNSATYNGENISEEDLAERRREVRCPRCGRSITDARVVKVKGLRGRGV